MVVSSETVINKMQEELNRAKEAKQHSKMMDHISKIKLLSELLLDEHDKANRHEQEEPSKKEQLTEKIISTHTAKELDGTSIFDF